MDQAWRDLRTGRFERRLGVPLVLGVAAVALAVQSGSPWFLLVAGAAVGVVLDSGLGGGAQGVALCLHAPRAVRAGDVFTVRMHVGNQGNRTSPPLAVALESPNLSDDHAYVAPLAAGARAEIDLPVVALRRGLVEQPVLCLRTTGPLGLVRRHTHARDPRSIVVRPAIVPALRLHGPSGAVGLQATQVAEAGDGLDVLGVREWRDGDDPARVHWRTTLRRGSPLVLERERSQEPGVLLVVVGTGPGVAWEHVVALACSSAVAELRHGGRVRVVGLGAAGRRSQAPVASVEDQLDWWARLDVEGLPDVAAVRAEVRPDEQVVVAVDGVRPGTPQSTWWTAVHGALGDRVRLLDGPATDVHPQGLRP